MASAITPTDTIKDAFERLEHELFPTDAKLFQNLTLKDVWDAARSIEGEQAARRSLQNTRRIAPLLEALSNFTGAIDTLCQGTPFLCYIWAPIKLMLVIFDGYKEAYEELINAYAEIASSLPRFDRLSNAFQNRIEFQSILADVYFDILEFHREMYKIARRGGWRKLFDASWRNFGARFRNIKENLVRNRDLVDREAMSLEIVDAQKTRRILLRDIERREKDTRDSNLDKVFSWLDLNGLDREQDDLLEKHAKARQGDTCNWLFKNSKLQIWLDEEDEHAMMWLKGKPGSGKSTIATFLAQHSPISPRSTIFCCLCSGILRYSTGDPCSVLFRLICATLLRLRSDVVPYVYDKFVRSKTTASLSRVREILITLLTRSDTTYLIIDGLDEYDSPNQERVIQELSQLLKARLETGIENVQAKIKLMLCSRETKELLRGVSRKLPKPLVVHLSEESKEVNGDIISYTKARLEDLRDRFGEEEIDSIGKSIVSKADGMFLWVQLILELVDERESLKGLRSAIDEMPEGLNGIYKTILDRLMAYPDAVQRQIAKRILGFLAFSRRSLKWFEVCDGVVFQDDGALTSVNKLGRSILNICKPLIEERPNGIVTLVHFSAKEYLTSTMSNLHLDGTQIHFDIALSCIRYLKTTNVFLNVEPSQTAILQIANGFHDLFPYVHSFWIDHVLMSQSEDASSSNTQTLSTMLWSLGDFEKSTNRLSTQEMTAGNARSPSPGSNKPISLTNDEKLARLPSCPEDVWNYVKLRLEVFNDGSRNSTQMDPAKDMTNLTAAYSKFRQLFESLLSTSWPELGLNSESMSDFRSRHSSSAYVCRWTFCPWASTGFASESDRARHENFTHKTPFQCQDAACDDWFSSRQALRRHQRTYHVKEDDWIIPNFNEDRQRDVSLVTSIDSTSAVDYGKQWYEPPNRDLVRKWATQLARLTPEEERKGIESRMSKTLLSYLDDDIKPAAYHFRKLAQKEFTIKQAEALNAGNVTTTPRKRKLMKNTVKALKQEQEEEQEAEMDMDADISMDLESVDGFDAANTIPSILDRDDDGDDAHDLDEID